MHMSQIPMHAWRNILHARIQLLEPASWSSPLPSSPILLTEPYFSAGLSVTANAWNTWDSASATAVNRLRWFESTAGAQGATYGSYNDPDWSAFINRMSLTSTDRPSSYNRSDAVVRFGNFRRDC